MITKKISWVDQLPPGYWGKVKGSVLAIHPDHRKSAPCAVYAIEEPPGYRVIRFNHRKYRVFCPWIYFMVRVWGPSATSQKPSAVNDGALYSFFSTKQILSTAEPLLYRSFFSNSYPDCGICLPDIDYTSEHPIEVALSLIWHFWASDGTEYRREVYNENVPGVLRRRCGKAVPYGRIFGKWSGMTPDAVMRLEYRKATPASIDEAVKGLDFDFI